jgi:predicted nucleic acid-binding Zn ribbon protein
LAESVHCPQCGANIAQEIKNWQIKQAQEQEKKAEKRKRTKKVLLAILIPTGILILLFVVAFLISEVQESQEYAERTATASAYNAGTPFKWISDSGELEVIVQPEISIAESGTFFVDLLYSNKSYQKCEFNEYQTYIMDDLGNTYVDTFADTAKDAFTGSYEPDLETVEPYTTEFLSVQSNSPLPDSVKKLIIYPSQFCGESVDPITVDLNSPWIKLDYWD